MFVTVPELSKITGISRNTIYSWIYRESFPDGLSIADIGNKETILKVGKLYGQYDKVLEHKKQKKVPKN